jgi:hypothetical protein
LKKGKFHIFYAWLLLIFFVAGQVAVYGHHHKLNRATSRLIRHQTSSSQQTVTEKCQLCDAMHHNTMVVNGHYYIAPIVVNQYNYKTVTYSFVSISLILSSGRAPPIS